MKKYIILILLSAVSFTLMANDSLTTAATELYKQGNYEEAIDMYQKSLADDEESAEIYYNLGNAYYKSNQIGKSILYYERALLIKPSLEDASFNLQMAQTKTIDKIDKVDSIFLKNWFDGFANILSSNAWATLSIILFILGIGLAFLYAFTSMPLLRRISVYAIGLLLLICVWSMVMAKRQKDKVEKREYAIIMASSVTVRSSPDEDGTSVFVLHEGTKVKILSDVDVWVEIKLEDGNVGWMLSSDLEKI